MLGEFEFIDAIVAGLGDRAAGDWITLGPGDDAAVITAAACPRLSPSPCCQMCIFLPRAQQLIGYRSLMVSFSDLAAMGAVPRLLLGLTFHGRIASCTGGSLVEALAQGMAAAAKELVSMLWG